MVKSVLQTSLNMTDSAMLGTLACPQKSRSRSVEYVSGSYTLHEELADLDPGQDSRAKSGQKYVQRTGSAPSGSKSAVGSQDRCGSEHPLAPAWHQSVVPPCSMASHRSCPDFAKESQSAEPGCSGTSAPDAPRRPSATLLTVPDIFTTSYTHSDPRQATSSARQRDGSPRKLPKKGYSESDLASVTPESGDSDEANQAAKRPLKKSLSDHNTGLARGQTATEPRLARLADGLYVGNLEAMYSQHVLCRARIASVVDLTNTQPDDVPRLCRTDAPCSCLAPSRHCPVTLHIRVRETDLVDIRAHFAKVNKFIDGARRNGKAVLVACARGDSLSVLTAVQYLMTESRLTYGEAMDLVYRADPDIALNTAYKELLRAVERHLVASGKLQRALVRLRTHRIQSTNPLRREAWTPP